MSNNLYVYERNMPTVAMMKSMEEQRDETDGMKIQFKRLAEVKPSDIDWCDVLTLIRPNDPYSVKIAKKAKEAGCFVISFFDDDLYNMPKTSPFPFWRRNNVYKAICASDMISGCSPHICNKYRDLTLQKRMCVSHTVVDPNEIKFIEKSESFSADKKVKLIYAANAGHVGFFDKFIKPIMPKLCERYAGQISMTFMGVRPELSEYEKYIEIEYFSSMPLEEYREKIKSGDYDIGLSPLTTDEFTKCKYFNKFIEYSIAGIMGVYSNTEPYTYVVEDRVNGFLVGDDPEEWFEALCEAIDDAAIRNRCICNAQELLVTRFNAEQLDKDRMESLPEATEYNKEKTPCKSLKLWSLLYKAIPIADKIYQTFFYLRRTGLSGFINKVKTHLRERKAYSK